MKVISFDVGIKNLAFNIIEYNENNLIIHEWKSINIIEEKINICLFCKNKAKFYIDIKDNIYYFCKRHINNKDILLKSIIEKNLNWVISDKKYFNSYLNLNLCYKDYKNYITNFNKNLNTIIEIKNNKIKNFTCDELKYKLIDILDNNKDIMLKSSNIILIENQPTLKNPTMKAISDTLYTWFLIRGIMDKDINNSIIDKIKFISPSNKLKKFKNELCLDNITESKKYNETKKLSINKCKMLLDKYNLDNWLNFFNNNTKKDDLADCFLQACFFLDI